MSKITLETTVVRADDLLATDLDGETILMSIEQSSYYGMDYSTATASAQILEPVRTA